MRYYLLLHAGSIFLSLLIIVLILTVGRNPAIMIPVWLLFGSLLSLVVAWAVGVGPACVAQALKVVPDVRRWLTSPETPLTLLLLVCSQRSMAGFALLLAWLSWAACGYYQQVAAALGQPALRRVFSALTPGWLVWGCLQCFSPLQQGLSTPSLALLGVLSLTSGTAVLALALNLGDKPLQPCDPPAFSSLGVSLALLALACLGFYGYVFYAQPRMLLASFGWSCIRLGFLERIYWAIRMVWDHYPILAILILLGGCLLPGLFCRRVPRAAPWLCRATLTLSVFLVLVAFLVPQLWLARYNYVGGDYLPDVEALREYARIDLVMKWDPLAPKGSLEPGQPVRARFRLSNQGSRPVTLDSFRLIGRRRGSIRDLTPAQPEPWVLPAGQSLERTLEVRFEEKGHSLTSVSCQFRCLLRGNTLSVSTTLPKY